MTRTQTSAFSAGLLDPGHVAEPAREGEIAVDLDLRIGHRPRDRTVPGVEPGLHRRAVRAEMLQRRIEIIGHDVFGEMLHREIGDLAEQRVGAVAENAEDRRPDRRHPWRRSRVPHARRACRRLCDQPASMPASMFAEKSVKPTALAFTVTLVLRPTSWNVTVLARFEHALAVRHVNERREHNSRVRHDLVEHTAHRVHGAVGALHVDQDLAAGTRIGLGSRIGPAVRTPPRGEMLRVRSTC